MNPYILPDINNVENLDENSSNCLNSPIIETTEVEITTENQFFMCTEVYEDCTVLTERDMLIKKMLSYIDDLSKIQKHVAIIISPSENEENCEIFGTEPLGNILIKNEKFITNNLTKAMTPEDPNLFKLPAIEPLPLENMNQMQLRSLIPTLIKMSTGRNRAGYGDKNLKPIWWPDEAPWANVRADVRPISEKKKLKFSNLLRKVVRSCYMHHGREDLLEKNKKIIANRMTMFKKKYMN